MQLSERVGRRMKLRDLHVLMTVVQAGSMGKAAQRLNTGQPAVSRSIAHLEHTLGVRLLDRDRRGVELTPYGRALLDCGVAVFDGLRRGVRDLEFLADPTAGEVRIGCNPFLAAGFASAVVDRLSRRYPRMAFHLVTGETETLYRHTYAVSSGNRNQRQRRVSSISERMVSGWRATSRSMTRAAIRPTPLVLRRLWRKANSSR